MQPVKVYKFTDANFYSSVLEASKAKPVIVDFWASWCEPCKVLGPVLEKVAADFADKIVLGKLNVDENPQISSYHKIQSIPVVIAYRNGQPASQFSGALPEAQVRKFFAGISISPSEQMMQKAEELLDTGQALGEPLGDESPSEPPSMNALGEAKILIQKVLEEQPSHPKAELFWVRFLFLSGQIPEAIRFIEKEQSNPENGAVEQEGPGSWIRNAKEFFNTETTSGLGAAANLLRKRDYPGCLKILLEAASTGTKEDKEASRKAMVALFVILGDRSPLTVLYRRKLYQALH